jgi:beta-lactam-binding protein with PASTA domain
MDFQEVDRRYADLKRQYDNGNLGAEEFDEHLEQMMAQDEEGRWWVKSPETGEWHYYDGSTWVQETPPGYQNVDLELETDGPLAETSGPSTMEVPDLAGQQLSRARSMLASASLSLGSQNEAPSDTVSKGRIIKQEPAAGTKAEQDSSVRVTVSSGPEEKAATTAVPDVSGRSIEEAGRTLSNATLVLAAGSRTKKSYEPAGTVISTVPAGGSEVALGTLVTPVVSGGPRTTAFPWIVAAGLIAATALVGLIIFWSPWEDTIEAPSLVGLTENAAERSAGSDFEIEVSGTKDSDEPKGTVLSQNPESGKEAQPGSTIYLIMSAGQPEEKTPKEETPKEETPKEETSSEEKLRTTVEDYYEAVDSQNWNYTYDNLDSQTKQRYTRDEYVRKNQYLASVDPVVQSSPKITSEISTSSPVEVTLNQSFKGGAKSRVTYFVWEDGSWKHRFSQQDDAIFLPEASYDEFVAAKQSGS